ncbi:uncharacterized protein EV420DRAFT_1644542 [Desarmillaria tabescens]|uniref:Protein kinase domain-containing protein n=1 Tax=Armillaria tabescens TaxID=1929756 RepID=A0AA39N386_ARMTA|nr:uncharacterized protein EV420DRAFT_1644542 [Desarmillaria tabescens]KAK0455764.1 hypothetical protein EV420DRAFT_1644542 [Desarmillaria tabescens]
MPFLLPWQQLTHYRDDYYGVRSRHDLESQFFGRCTRLRECILLSWLPTASVSQSMLPDLTSLVLGSSQPLNTITAPALQFLMLYCGQHEEAAGMGFLSRFISRSSCSLTVLVLFGGTYPCHIESDDLVPVLKASPRLTQLSVYDVYIQEHFLQCMTLSTSSDMVPLLENLTLDAFSFTFSIYLLFSMLESRNILQEVSIKGSDIILVPHGLLFRYAALREKGFRLHFGTYDASEYNSRDRRLTSSVAGKQVSLPQTGDDLYRPGTTLDLKFQTHKSADYKDLAATVIKRFEPFTSAVVLLVQRLPDNQPFILKLADDDDVDTVPWTSSIDDHLRRTIHDIQAGVKPDWFELINDFDNRPDTRLWEDWMWEVCTWIGKMSSYDTELSAYRLLHRLQGRCIPRLYGVVRLQITPESTPPLHPITDVVQGVEAEKISSAVLDGFRAIEAEKCLLHNVVHTKNIVLREGNRSPVIIDFGLANIRNPEYSDEEWEHVVQGGPDTCYLRRLLVDPEDGRWKRTVTPYHYKRPLPFNEYVESMPDDFRRVTFESVLNTDWEGAREKTTSFHVHAV